MSRQDEFRRAMPPVTDVDRNPADPEVSGKITNMLASTSVPPEHLSGLRHIVTHDGTYDSNAAMYMPRSREMFVNTGGSDWQNDAATRRSLVHELGHHVHTALNPQQFSHPEQEAVAENYADRHAPGGASKYDQITDLGFSTFKGSDHKADIELYKRTRQAGTMPDTPRA